MNQDSNKMDLDINPKKQDSVFSERLVQFFEEQKFTDCSFRFQEKNLKAHKFILACASPVFERMFFGEMASDTVFLNDISFENFYQTLRFIYSTHVKIYSVQNAWGLYYIAEKYLLNELMEICLGYISKKKSMSSLILSYEYAEFYDLVVLKNELFCDMKWSINALFFSGYHMKPSTLTALLKSNFVLGNASKLDLISHVINWAIRETEIQGMECADADNIVQLLKSQEILKFISKSWFSEWCAYCNEQFKNCLCINETARSVARKLVHPELVWEEHSKNMNYNLSVIPSGIHKRDYYKIARRIDLSESEEFVSCVEVDKECVVYSLLVYTETKPNNCLSDWYDGSITIKFCRDDGNENVVEPTKIVGRFSYTTFVELPLRFPVTMRSGQFYKIKISYKNYCSKRKSILVCRYMSSEVVDTRKINNARMRFYDDGSVIQGVGYYPV